MAPAQGGRGIRVALGAMRPNFRAFGIRCDGGAWMPTEVVFDGPIPVEEDRLEAVTINAFGVEGPVSKIVLRGD